MECLEPPTLKRPREYLAQKAAHPKVQPKSPPLEETPEARSGGVKVWERIKTTITSTLPFKRQDISQYDPPSVVDQAEHYGWSAGFYSFPDESHDRIYYNPALVDFEGSRWLFARCVSPRYYGTNLNMSGIVAWRLRGNHPSEHATLQFRMDFKKEEFEDPRVISFRGRLLISYCNFIRNNGTNAHQCVSFLDSRFKAANPVHPVFGANVQNLMRQKGHEKNWVFFENEGLLYFIYRQNGVHEVCELTGHLVYRYHNTVIDGVPPWPYGEIRGGTPPIFINGRYIAFFHSSQNLGNTKRYYMGAYEFDARPPFKVTRRTPMALLTGSRFDPMGVERKPVVFPGGAVMDGSDWLVVFGVNDCRCGWVRIPMAHLDKMLKSA